MLQKVFINTDSLKDRHCEERSDEAISKKIATPFRARNDNEKAFIELSI